MHLSDRKYLCQTISTKCTFLTLVLMALLGLPRRVNATAGGSISGTVRDSSGAVIPKATVVLTSAATGLQQTVASNDTGTYAFPAMPVGHYNLKVTAPGFRAYLRTGIMLNVNSALLVDVVLEVGSNVQTVAVHALAVQVNTASTQLGQVIAGKSLTALPLNGRSYTDLLALQPGVIPVTTITSMTVQGLGESVFSPSGSLNPGTLSINGQRESSNGFTVNGADAEETGSMAAAVIPNLDSITEFRILSDNFDARYGRYSGGEINVVTKSGGSAFHGDVFEFLRNTDLDARNYFSPSRGTFIQNQFGGTFGGPLLRGKAFFFTDYQGTRQTQGVDTGLIPVPSLSDRTGNLSDEASALTGTVGGPYWANLLSTKLGYPVVTGERYYVPGCTTPSECVLPNATIPRSAWSAPALALLPYIPKPSPNANSDVFSTSANDQTLRDDKIGERIDVPNAWGEIFGYYVLDNYTENNPYPTAQGGANVPGFNALNEGRAQLVVLSDTKTIGASAVNAFHISYTRDANDLGKPDGGLGVSLASQGFVTGAGTLGIVPGTAQGVENIVFNDGGLVIGATPGEFHQVNNNFGVSESFAKLAGTHSITFGTQLEYDQINTYPYSFLNGSFVINGSETGLGFADFLLGISSEYTQNQLRPFYERNRYVGLYAQDSWRAVSDLTLNYGIRWARIEPWYEKYNNNITFIPGEQSLVFPTAPAGIVYPGDPGVLRTVSPVGNRDFAPRVGLAYSPSGHSGTLLGKLLGGPGKTSIRAGFGLFYAVIPGETLSLVSDNAPYGYTFQNVSDPLLTTPFVDGNTGRVEGQRFPAQLAPLNVSRSNPDSNINFSEFEPFGAIPGYKTTNTIPYTEEYMLSLERQIGTATVVSVDYVGNEAHHLLVLEAANPGNPALCLSIPGCGPNVEQTYKTRGPFGPAFGSISYQTTIGNSNYNALEASVRLNSARANLLFSYTYSKSIDMSSNFGEQVDPFDPNLLRGISAFDMRQDFIASYTCRIPFGRLFHSRNRWTQGWSISGITRFSTGLPVTLINPFDTSLMGTFGNGINNLSIDELDRAPGPLDLNDDARNGQPYFNTALFSVPADDPAIGDTIANTIGNSGRRFFSGPGIDNFDLTLQKNVKLTEAKSLELRVEAFNVFNHAQFYGPLSVDGNIGDSTFGRVVSAAAPRLVQVAAKFLF